MIWAQGKYLFFFFLFKKFATFLFILFISDLYIKLFKKKIKLAFYLIYDFKINIWHKTKYSTLFLIEMLRDMQKIQIQNLI